MKRTLYVLVFMLFPSIGFADTIHVPGDQPTIQAGIDAAVDGDTVLVADGTYTGSGNRDISFLGKAITVRSGSGPDSCIIDCEALGRGFFFHHGEDHDSVLEGFTIRNGNASHHGGGYGGAINLANSSPTIANNIILDNFAEYGGGIYCRDAFPLITGTAITGNTAEIQGGGMHVSDSSSPTVLHCVINGNTAQNGGGIHCWSTSLTIINSVISGNSAPFWGQGGGIDSYRPISLTVTNCTIYGNHAGHRGGGIRASHPEYSSITNCIIWGNSPDAIHDDPTVAYSDVQGGWPGEGNIDANPLFVTGPLGNKYLSQIAAGQAVDSPCVDAGDPASMMIDGFTRTDGVPDSGIVDMGYHYFDTIPQFPALWLSATEFELTGVPGGSNPPDQTFEIRNSGSGTFNYEITESIDWLAVSPLAGGPVPPPATATVAVDTEGLGAGTYEGLIYITAPGAQGSPQAVHVSLELIPPTLSVYPNNVRFLHILGGANPPDRTISIRNAGYGTFDYEISESADWLEVTPLTGGPVPPTATAHVSVDVSGLPPLPDTYNAEITVTAPGASGSPEVVNVRLDIGFYHDPQSYPTGEWPSSVAIGDLNLDGHPDLAVTNAYDYSVSVLLGNGDGTFQDAVSYGAGEFPQSVAIGDLNGDGRPDLAVANMGFYYYGDGDVSVLLGNGDGTFPEPVSILAGGSPVSVAIGDLNLDGHPDLAVANTNDFYYSWLPGDVSVLLGNGDGTFQFVESAEVDLYPSSLAIGDLDEDGHPDLVVTNRWSDNISVLPGNGDGTLGDASHYDTGDRPLSVAIGDLDEDGHLDLATANGNSDSVSVLPGNGDGAFQEVVDYAAGDNPTAVAIRDLDLDGHLDLAVANGGSDDVSVLLGTEDGAFLGAMSYDVGDEPTAVAAGDLDGDCDPDLVVANGYSDNVAVLINSLNSALLVIGPGPALNSPPLVRMFPPIQDAAYTRSFEAYGAAHFGVNVSCGDMTGDGRVETLTGAGPGEVYGPHVRGFEADGSPLPRLSFLAYGTDKWGVNVAAGNIDDDEFDEIITGAGPGGVFGPHVRGWDYDGVPPVVLIPTVSFFAYGTPKWGVNVSCGDIDGDGYDEIVTGAGPGAVYGPHVRGWDVDNGPATAIPGVNFLAYGTNKFGVNVTCGDLDGDGIDEIVTGPGPGPVFGAHIRGWNYDGGSVTELAGINFLAWDPTEARYGGKVFSGADLNCDGRDELVVGCGPDPNAATVVKVYEYEDSHVSLWFSLEAFSDMELTHGVNVAGGRF